MTSLKCLVFLFCGAVSVGVLPAFSQTNLTGTVAPAPVLSTFSGHYQLLSSLYYAGDERPNEPKSAVVLNFMGVNCGPCLKELPQFLAVVRSSVELASKAGVSLKFFLVSVDPLSAKEALRKYVEERKIDLESELLLDPYHKAADKFGVTAIPRTFVISAQGVVAVDIAGSVDDYAERLRGGIATVLKNKVK